jgi:glutamate synthase (NADPH) large chain
MKYNEAPGPQGLYDPQYEHDACGIGIVANIKGKKSNEIVCQALTVLKNLTHRGGSGSETNTGDGAGILMQVPHAFLKKECDELGINLTNAGEYGIGMVFLPIDEDERRTCEVIFENIIKQEGQNVLGWRTVPTDDSTLGSISKACKPFVRQIFIGRGRKFHDEVEFDRKLYMIRKRAENAIRYSEVKGGSQFYIASLSCKTIVYKGMLVADQLEQFYPDLKSPFVEAAIAMVHSRYSTNTFPSWDRAHPYRYIMHNGEINTLHGNVNWMNARHSSLKTDLFDGDLSEVFPIINPDGSDSGMFDNTLEFLALSGRSIPHAMMMMIPEPWNNHENMSDAKKAFYEFHGCLMEPWDGPAAIGFTDGVMVGAVLDRNGLRPSRYYVTTDDLVVLASEVGVLEIGRASCRERVY